MDVAAASLSGGPTPTASSTSSAEWTHYDPAVHGIFDHGRLVGDDDPDDEGDPDAELSPTPDSLATEFALEAHLEEFMATNWDRLEFGVPLEPVVDEMDTPGRQYTNAFRGGAH